MGYDANKVQTLTWDDAKNFFLEFKPDLYEIIDKLSPDKTFQLFKVSYPYLATIAEDGKLHFPAEKKCKECRGIPIDSPDIPKNIKDNLQRRDLPVGMIVKNSAEIFKTMPDRVISRVMLEPGSFFGLWGNLDQDMDTYVKWTWHLVSGAKSVYMLPKITNAKGHKRVQKKYGIPASTPKDWKDHSNIFSQLTQSSQFVQEWDCEFLFFSDKWFDTAIKDPAWRDFYIYMFQEAWRETNYWRNKNTFEMVWEDFVYKVLTKNLKPNLYLACILKQLILTGIGAIPGFTVSGNDDLAGPFTTIQKIYLVNYGIEKMPTIMVPHHFSMHDKSPTYYSFQYPNLLETIPIPLHVPSILESMPSIKKLMDSFKQTVMDNNVVMDSLLYKFFSEVSLEYFHSQKEEYNNIHSTEELPNYDERLARLSVKDVHRKYEKRSFAAKSQFLNGCVIFISKQK